MVRQGREVSGSRSDPESAGRAPRVGPDPPERGTLPALGLAQCAGPGQRIAGAARRHELQVCTRPGKRFELCGRAARLIVELGRPDFRLRHAEFHVALLVARSPNLLSFSCARAAAEKTSSFRLFRGPIMDRRAPDASRNPGASRVGTQGLSHICAYRCASAASRARNWSPRGRTACAARRLHALDRRHPSTSKKACLDWAAPLVQSDQLVDLSPQLPTLRPDDCEATQLVWGKPLFGLARRVSEVNHVRLQTCYTPLEIGHTAAGRREGSVTPHPLIERTPALRVVAATAREHHVPQHRVAPESDGDEVVPSADIGGATEDAFRRTRFEELDDGLHLRFSKMPRREALSNSACEDGESERRSHALRDSRKPHPHFIPVTRLSAISTPAAQPRRARVFFARAVGRSLWLGCN